MLDPRFRGVAKLLAARRKHGVDFPLREAAAVAFKPWSVQELRIGVDLGHGGRLIRQLFVPAPDLHQIAHVFLDELQGGSHFGDALACEVLEVARLEMLVTWSRMSRARC